MIIYIFYRKITSLFLQLTEEKKAQEYLSINKSIH